LTKEKRHFSNGKIYLGMYTFLIKGAALITEVNDVLVASDTKLNIHAPVI
jgi:hypothetical protein